MEAPTRKPSTPEWWLDLLLVVVLLAGAFFRFYGIYWGEWTYMHPDERFLVWVGTDISPLQPGSDPEARQWLTLNEYFDTPNSPLNPNNRGHGFYVYGTLPMFLTRYVVELIYGHSGFQEMTEVGRPLSALSDLLVVFLVYLVAKRLYNRKVGLLAAAFSAAAVLQIQQSHFFTMDTFLNFFMMLAVYFAVLIMTSDWDRNETRAAEEGWSREGGAEVFPYPEYPPRRPRLSFNQILRHPLFLPALGFGLALGMAMASKVSSILIPLLLPAAMLIRMAQMSDRERRRHLLPALGYLALAAVVSVIVFRIFQPYAFSGPGFFGVKLNEVWLENLRTQRAQATADADFPPAMQWARRPVWFSAQNLVLWGLGLPLGVLAFFGVGWAGWQMLKGKWQRHALLWGWTMIYFVWQSLQINPTMRYQLPIYPMLAIFAGWAVMELFQAARRNRDRLNFRQATLQRLLGAGVGVGVLAATYIYAFAFVNGVYGQMFTRAAASYWVYQNIPGSINLPIQTGEGTYNQPVPFPYSFTITPGVPYLTSIRPNASGSLSEIVLHHVLDMQPGDEERTLRLTLSAQTEGAEPLATAELQGNFPVQPQFESAGYPLSLSQPVMLDQEQTYSLRLELLGDVTQPDVVGNGQLRILGTGGELFEQGFDSPVYLPASGQPFYATFVAQSTGLLTQIGLSEVTLTSAALLSDGTPPAFDSLPPGHVSVSLAMPGEDLEYLEATLTAKGTGAGEYLLRLDEPIPVNQGETYALSMAQQTTSGAISLMGAGIANEGDWDDGLPLRVDKYDGFGGIYPLDLNFNMYWDDNPDKLARFTRILDQAEYVLITSSRQWGSLPRIPERFPMTTIYYRNLLGCPVTREIEWCYNVAEPGRFQGNLGYDLVEVIANHPRIGAFEINDQFAEEAFTVYDHPKVFVFRKRADYDPQRVAALLSAVDFSKIIRIPPMRAGSQPANLMLPEERWAQQQAGGTWSALFDTNGLLNRYPAVGAVVWYLSVFLLGLVAYPALRLAFPGLPDHGYPLARIAGLLALSYLSWLAGSLAPGLLPFTRTTIAIMAGLMLLGAILLGFRQRAELRAEWRGRRKYFLIVEGLFLAFFVLDLLIRIGNPDLWHPWKGGEKPMDFSYFNSVLKSTSFPPYDPWYAGGYLNYYYYGFVFVGTLVKLLGIVPAIAYNLILPTLFAMIALGAFSIAFNLYTSVRGAILPLTGGEGVSGEGIRAPAEPREEILPPGGPDPEPAATAPPLPPQLPPYSYWVGLAGALGMALLGNLGSVRMIFQGYQRLAAPGGVLEGAGLFQRWAWALEGFIKVLGGETLPYNIGDWYWIPSRAIPAPGDVEPITEFPFFTVLYADPHAHLFALPIALLALSFALAVVLGNGRWRSLLGGTLAFLLGGLAIGALRPTNTWDFPTYLALGVLALVYSQMTNFCLPRRLARRMPFLDEIPRFSQRFLAALAAAGLLALMAFILYQPYAEWYGLGYTKIDAWKGTHTPLDAYLTHWGLFLFVIVTWMFWETHQWMAQTPLSALRRLAPYKGLVQGALVLLLAVVAGLIFMKVRIAWFALPLAAWAGVLLLKPHQPNAKRFILFLIGTGLVLTLMVELIVLRGDIGRMNTVFKFYLQVWTLFAVSAAAGLGWLLLALPGWLPNWRVAFKAVLTVLVAGAALYPLLAGTAKVKDRMYDNAPHTLDGLAFMERATYGDEWGTMDLGQDYRAIRWMQENIPGSPVIVEANLRNLYRWGSRFSIYTGLPGVVGWEWHQQQQRALVPADWVSSRIAEVDEFYLNTDLGQAMNFLRKYDVAYIVVGQQERGHYPGPGLDKFEAQDGLLWNEVYREGETVIYQVNGDI